MVVIKELLFLILILIWEEKGTGLVLGVILIKEYSGLSYLQGFNNRENLILFPEYLLKGKAGAG